MNLETVLKKENMSIASLAAKLDVHYTHVLRIIHGSRRPSPELALKIEQITNGAITRMELLYPELEQKTASSPQS